MIRIAFVCAVIVLTLASVTSAQLAETRFINFVDTKAVVTFSQSGEGRVPLDPQTENVIKTTGYRKVSIRIGSTSATTFIVHVGKISNATLSQSITWSKTSKIKTIEVIGPEMVLYLTGGKPNTTEEVQLWVYLSS